MSTSHNIINDTNQFTKHSILVLSRRNILNNAFPCYRFKNHSNLVKFTVVLVMILYLCMQPIYSEVIFHDKSSSTNNKNDDNQNLNNNNLYSNKKIFNTQLALNLKADDSDIHDKHIKQHYVDTTNPEHADRGVHAHRPRRDTHHENEAHAPRGKHFEWKSSWQDGKKVPVLAIE